MTRCRFKVQRTGNDWNTLRNMEATSSKPVYFSSLIDIIISNIDLGNTAVFNHEDLIGKVFFHIDMQTANFCFTWETASLN